MAAMLQSMTGFDLTIDDCVSFYLRDPGARETLPTQMASNKSSKNANPLVCDMSVSAYTIGFF